jgi:hypothetical protein
LDAQRGSHAQKLMPVSGSAVRSSGEVESEPGDSSVVMDARQVLSPMNRTIDKPGSGSALP